MNIVSTTRVKHCPSGEAKVRLQRWCQGLGQQHERHWCRAIFARRVELR